MAQSALRALTQQLMQSGPAPSGMASYQTAVQNATNRPQNSADMLAGLSQFTSLDTPQNMSLGATAADIGMGFLPGVGTAQGIRDFERARRDDDMLGMALGGLSAIPFAGGIVKAGKGIGRAAEGALDMSQAARMQRADEMGYLPETVYHGTAQDISEFNPRQFGGSVTKAGSAKMGTWFSDNPEVAATYARYAAEDVPVSKILDQADRAGRARNFDEQERLYALAEELELSGQLRNAGGQNIIPARLRGNLMEINAEGATMSDLDESQLLKWAEEARSKGLDGLKISNFSDNADYGQYMPATHYLVFDPANIRSANAAFDPTKRNSANLMAGIMGGAVGLSALRQLMPQQEQE